MPKSLKRGTWKGLELFLGGVWGAIPKDLGRMLGKAGESKGELGTAVQIWSRASCAFRSPARSGQVYGGVLVPFFAFFRNFFDILTHLKLSCNFLTFFNDFSSSLRGFGMVWGWILGGFF